MGRNKNYHSSSNNHHSPSHRNRGSNDYQRRYEREEDAYENPTGGQIPVAVELQLQLLQQQVQGLHQQNQHQNQALQGLQEQNSFLRLSQSSLLHTAPSFTTAASPFPQPQVRSTTMVTCPCCSESVQFQQMTACEKCDDRDQHRQGDDDRRREKKTRGEKNNSSHRRVEVDEAQDGENNIPKYRRIVPVAAPHASPLRNAVGSGNSRFRSGLANRYSRNSGGSGGYVSIRNENRRIAAAKKSTERDTDKLAQLDKQLNEFQKDEKKKTTGIMGRTEKINRTSIMEKRQDLFKSTFDHVARFPLSKPAETMNFRPSCTAEGKLSLLEQSEFQGLTPSKSPLEEA